MAGRQPFVLPSNAGIILLKDGTDTSQGIPQLISNINACSAIVDILATTLGPRGMDKLIYQGNSTTISNDGATIMKLLDIVHPAAKTLVDIAQSQDAEVGDGTTSVVLLAGELLKEAKKFIEEGVHPFIISSAYRSACAMAREMIKSLSVNIDPANSEELREMLLKCASTALNSKLIHSQKNFFATMVVDAVMHLDDDLTLKMIGIKKEKGGSLEHSMFVEGVAFKKTFSYAGFEQQPKYFKNPKILLLNLELELKSEKENAEIRIKSPQMYQDIVDAEWRIIYEKLENCVKSGAQIVLSRLAIGDLATQYFADRKLFSAGRVTEEDLLRVSKATGGSIQSSVNNLIPEVLGTCDIFEEKQIGGERYNFFSGCKHTKTATIILRGGGDAFNDEAERSLHDSIMVVRRARKHSSVVPGGGAIEMEVSKLLRQHARGIAGREQSIMLAFAKALECIPRRVALNAGFDCTDILNKLRQKHATNGVRYGVDITNGDVCDTYESHVWEPSLVKYNALEAACEACCMILSIDETVKNPAAQQGSAAENAPVPHMGRR